MAGFMTTTTAMRLFKCAQASDPVTKLEMNAFGDTPPVPRGDGRRAGWVGLGDPLDVNFSLGIDHGQYLAFSLRVDSRVRTKHVSVPRWKNRLACSMRKKSHHR